jgi:glycosyltransferase involved in cell wall biosynthesis
VALADRLGPPAHPCSLPASVAPDKSAISRASGIRREQRLRILFLTYEIPAPLDSGDRIYTAHLLQQLARRGHDVHLVAFNREPPACTEFQGDSAQVQSRLAPSSRTTMVEFHPKTHRRAFFSVFPGMIANRRSGAFVAAVRHALAIDGPFDVVIVNHFKMAYLATPLKRAAPGIATVLVTHNAEAPLSESVYRNHARRLRRAAYYLDFVKTAHCEPHYLHGYDVVTAICEPDREYFSRRYGLTELSLLPPGIDVADYPAQFPDPSRNRGVILCGSFLWEPKKLNLLALLNTKSFGLLDGAGIKLMVVGQADPAQVRTVNRSYPGVIMTGGVPDVRRHYRGCSIALVPEAMGGGFKLKVLEAAALKRAIVGLANAVAIPGFVAGVHHAEARDMEELISTTLSLMKTPERIARMAAEAHELVRTRYTWDQAGDHLMRAISRAIALRRAARSA